MRTTIRWTLVSAAVIAAACSKSTPRNTTALSDDLKRDLQLASQTQNIQISPDEVSPQAKQEMAVRPKRAPQGPRVIRSQRPTVKASPKPVEVAETNANVPQIQVTASAPAPSDSPSPDAPPMARPSPIPAQTYPANGRSPGDGGGQGIGATIGGILGGILIGGDDDHCDPHGVRRPRGGRPIGGDIYGRPGSWPGRVGGVGGRIGGGFPIISVGRP